MLNSYYQVGGSLNRTQPSYVKRDADSALTEALKKGEFCYVLNSRQMGKSSLRVRAMQQLKNEGLRCAAIDITKIGNHFSPEAWYKGFADELLRVLSLSRKVNLKDWWLERDTATPVQRLGLLIEEVLLLDSVKPLAIFIDEIDSTIKLDKIKDDFFAFIRACYNERVDKDCYNRLTFCLLGVATPSDLIADKTRTPFNIGRAIELTGFTFEEARDALTRGLEGKVDDPEGVLKEVLDWTGGQPFLTQKLCDIVVNYGEGSNPNISELVRTRIIDNWEGQDEPEHLRTIRDRIFSSDRSAEGMLTIYQKILLEGKIKADKSLEQIYLRLSGLVVKRKGALIIYNQIYEFVFNDDWVSQELEKIAPEKTKQKIVELKSQITELEQKLKQSEEASRRMTNPKKRYAFLWLLVFAVMSARLWLPRMEILWQEVVAPNITNLLNKTGTKNYIEGKYETAEFFYRLALMAEPDFNKSRYGLAAVCERREDFDCANKQYKLAMQDKNIRVAARAANNLARLQIFQELDYQTAIALVSVALKQTESPALEAKVKSDLYKNLGWAHLVENNYAEAEKNLRQAIAADEINTPAYCLLAQVLEGQEKEAEALGQWQKCLDYPTPPQNPEVNIWKIMARQRLK